MKLRTIYYESAFSNVNRYYNKSIAEIKYGMYPETNFRFSVITVKHNGTYRFLTLVYNLKI